MAPFPAPFWLEKTRLAVQCGWFGLFLGALFFSVFALWRGGGPRFRNLARVVWAVSVLFFAAMWGAGAVLEMMRRAALVSGSELILALGAFSVLLAGVLSLVREWFGAGWNEPLRGQRVALSLLVLTVAGWWFGGLSLSWNALWNFAPFDYDRVRAPDGWALALGGATLLGAATLVQSRDEAFLRVYNPRPATWWLCGFALWLAFPVGGRNPLAASAFLLGAGVFLSKIWRARLDCPRFLRLRIWSRIPLLIAVAAWPLLVWHEPPSSWQARIAISWKTPGHIVPFLLFLAAILGALCLARRPLRQILGNRFSLRALLPGTLAGALSATLFFGPAGALCFAFWPLTGLFFDLLRPCEPEPLEPAFATDFAPAAASQTPT